MPTLFFDGGNNEAVGALVTVIVVPGNMLPFTEEDKYDDDDNTT